MKTKWNNIYFLGPRVLFGAIVLIFASGSQAVPIPGTATSELVGPNTGLYRSALGFQIGAGTSGWNLSESPGGNRYIVTMFRSPGAKFIGENGTLTVRVDKLNRPMVLEKYVQRWMKEYPKYGFDVLGSRIFAQNRERGYVLDLVNRDNGKQLRQVVFLHKSSAVILTCRDQSAVFKESLRGCNQIIRTFKWSD